MELPCDPERHDSVPAPGEQGRATVLVATVGPQGRDPSQGRRSIVQVLGSPVGAGLNVGHMALHVNGSRVHRGNHDKVWHVA
eukprot:12158701-Alexandrium_andersonii.AAC.1